MTNFIPVPNIFTLYSPHLEQERVLGTTAKDFDLIPYGNNAPELSTRPMDWTPALHPKNAVFQLKVDGISAIYIAGKFWSIQGTPLHCCDHAIPDMERLEKAFGYPMVFACEYEAGQFRKTISAMRSGKPGQGTVWVYDGLPFEQWKKNDSREPLHVREAFLHDAFENTPLMHSGFLRTMGCKLEDIPTIMEDVGKLNLEGIVVKDANSFFTRARSSSWLKLKIVNTFDGVICEYSKTSISLAVPRIGVVKVTLDIPPRLKEIMAKGDGSLLGKHVEIEANVEPGADAPRHSRFVRSREDKDC